MVENYYEVEEKNYPKIYSSAPLESVFKEDSNDIKKSRINEFKNELHKLQDLLSHYKKLKQDGQELTVQ